MSRVNGSCHWGSTMVGKAGLVMAALTAMVAVIAPATASAAPVYCGIDWGSGEKTGPVTTGGTLVGLCAGGHDCYDRLVFDVPGPAGGYHVSYVDEVTEDPTGNPVPLRGGAKLQATVYSPAYDQSGAPTYVYANRIVVDVAHFW
jgi:hypothetical protein